MQEPAGVPSATGNAASPGPECTSHYDLCEGDTDGEEDGVSVHGVTSGGIVVGTIIMPQSSPPLPQQAAQPAATRQELVRRLFDLCDCDREQRLSSKELHRFAVASVIDSAGSVRCMKA